MVSSSKLWSATVPATIAILEPHYDDAWLNLGGAMLMHPEQRFLIISICMDEKNYANETRKLSQVFSNIETIELGLHGITYSFRGTLKEAIDTFCKTNRLSGLPELGCRIDEVVNDCHEIFLPLGLEHPQHAIVSQIPLSNQSAVSFYREFPYFFSRPLADYSSLFAALKGRVAHARTVLSKTYNLRAQRINIRSCHEHKINVFKEIYQSQHFLLTLRRGNVNFGSLKDEIIFRRKPLLLNSSSQSA
jgi:hypothetical protein